MANEDQNERAELHEGEGNTDGQASGSDQQAVPVAQPDLPVSNSQGGVRRRQTARKSTSGRNDHFMQAIDMLVNEAAMSPNPERLQLATRIIRCQMAQAQCRIGELSRERDEAVNDFDVAQEVTRLASDRLEDLLDSIEGMQEIVSLRRRVVEEILTVISDLDHI